MFGISSLIGGTDFSLLSVLLTGSVGGFTSGFLGTGCGIIITPLLMDFGLPPFVAIPTQLCHAVGTNFTSFLSYKRRTDVDYLFAFFILVGGCFGAFLEWIFLKNANNPEVILHKFSYIYIGILIVFGSIMLFQSIVTLKYPAKKITQYKLMMRKWMQYLPLHKVFGRFRVEASVTIPIFIGLMSGILVASLGGGSNLFIAPVITYLIGRISPVVYGTTAMASFVVTALVALIYASQHYCCDIALVLLLFVGASFGSWLGVKLTYKIRRSYINIISSGVMFFMAGKQLIKVLNANSAMSNYTLSTSEGIIVHPVRYTSMCIILVMIIAYFYERTLEKISKTRWFRK